MTGSETTCPYCGEPAGPDDWAGRQWGQIEQTGPAGVSVLQTVHAQCYLHHAKGKGPGEMPRFRPPRR